MVQIFSKSLSVGNLKSLYWKGLNWVKNCLQSYQRLNIEDSLYNNIYVRNIDIILQWLYIFEDWPLYRHWARICLKVGRGRGDTRNREDWCCWTAGWAPREECRWWRPPCWRSSSYRILSPVWRKENPYLHIYIYILYTLCLVLHYNNK